MSTTRIDAIVHAYLDELAKQGIIVDQAYLYGSQARGEANRESDIDLIIISQSFAEIPALEQWRILGKTALTLMEPVEVLPLTPKELEFSLKQEGNFVKSVLSDPETIEYKM